MENESKGIAWFGNMYQKFEDMCLEVDDIVRQEGLKYVEDQLQTVGANVKQFCSEFVRDVLSTSSEGTGEDSDDKLHLVANNDVVEEIPKDVIAEDHFKKDLSWSLQSVKGKQKESNSEENVDARKKLEVVSILEKWLEEKYSAHLMLDKIPIQNKDEGSSTLPMETDGAPGINSCTETSSIDVKSVNLVDNCESLVLDAEVISSGASAESIGKQDNITGASDLGSSFEEKLDGSCIVVNRSEFDQVSGKTRSSSYQREATAKQSHDPGATEFSNSNLGSFQLKGGLTSSSIVVLGDGSFESDWEIV